MQNKGLVKLFAVLFGLVCIYQLSFTWKANQIESQAKTYAINKIADTDTDYQEKRKITEFNYLDSLQNTRIGEDENKKLVEVYNFLGVASYNYNEVQNNALSLGLDLKGGINVILEISVKDILTELSNNSKDVTFKKALADATELQKDDQGAYLESFFEAFDAIKGDKKLASPEIFANSTFSDISLDMSDSEVKDILRVKVEESIKSTFEVLRSRIDKFGVTSPNIQRLGTSGRVLIELPGAKDIERTRELLTKKAQLEFWDTYTAQELTGYLLEVNQKLVEEAKAKKEAQEETTDENSDDANTAITEEDSDENDLESTIDELTGQLETDSTDTQDINPLKIQNITGGPVIGNFLKKDKDSVMYHIETNRALLPAEFRNVKFAWGKESDESDLVELYALKGKNIKKAEPRLTGSVITDARQTYDRKNQPAVSMKMDTKGSKIWEEITGDAYNNRGFIAIVLDDIVYSAPSASNGPISGGSTEITGNFKLDEATDLATVLQAGKLPASAEIVQADEVGPSLGQEAIDSGLTSFMIALIFVLVWMIFYYGKAGLAADIALLFNILLIFGCLASDFLGAVLTLPGIAGIVLTIGISVDANVLIFERIREELEKGKDQKSSIKDGFSNAMSSILDANITTGLTAIILFIFGTGPVKGFATTLIIGILTSLFTAIFITRLFIDWWSKRDKSLDFSTPITKGLFKNVDINFLAKRKIAYIISGAIILGGLISLTTIGLDQGIDFVGGRTYQVRFDKDVNTEDIKSDLVAVFESAEVKTIGGNNQLKISTKYKVNDNTLEADEEVQTMLFEAIKKYFPENFTYEEFKADEGNKSIGKVLSSKVSPTIADDIKSSSFLAILGSLVVVFLYILIRFKRWQFSLGAVAAVFHDVLIVLGIFSICWKFMPFTMEIDQAFIAAILTVIGYSLNDTVVVFDRIREFFNEHTTWSFDKTINKSLNSTLSRTLNTSVTTLVVLLAMFAFGADSLKGLLFALIVGVLVGTYSSLFIATPVMYDTAKKGDATESLKKKVKEEETDEATV